MEPSPIPTEEPKARSTHWGAIIGLVLILAIVVAGAYYSFTNRYHSVHTAASAQQ